MIIKEPIITEKAVSKVNDGLYVFEVAKGATKTSIKQDIEKRYGVKVKNVRTVNSPAKTVSFKRVPGKRSAHRKAYVWVIGKKLIKGFEEFSKDAKQNKEKEVKEENAKNS